MANLIWAAIKGVWRRDLTKQFKVHRLAHFILQPRFEIIEMADYHQIVFVDNFPRMNAQAHTISTIKISTNENTKLPPKTRL